MRTMYDACNPSNIPKDATMVAGYIYGNCKWPASVWASWAHVTCVRIATVAFLDDGQVLDVESGDASPSLAPGWCVRARARGQDPTVYCNVSTWPSVRAAIAAQHVVAPHWWLAHYGVAPVIPAGAHALQYRNSVAPGFDVSVVADYWPGIDPVPQPIPNTQGDKTMWMYQDAAGTIWMVNGGTRLSFQHIADVDRYLAQGVKLYTAAEFTPEWNAALLKYPAL